MRKKSHEVFEVFNCGRRVFSFSGSRKDCVAFVDEKMTDKPDKNYVVVSPGRLKL